METKHYLICYINNSFLGIKESDKISGKYFVLVIKRIDDQKNLSKNVEHHHPNTSMEIIAEKGNELLQIKACRDNEKAII